MASVLALALMRGTTAFAADELFIAGSVATNYWVVAPSISKTAWRAGTEAATVVNGEPKHGISTISYLNRLSGAVTNGMPTLKGEYTVRFTVPPGTGYEGLEAATNFTITGVSDIGESGKYHSVYDYAGHVDFTVNFDPSTNVVENFPLYIKVRKDSPAGFSYDDILTGRDSIRFFDSTGYALDYEIAAWDTSGESAFWVQVPRLGKNSVVTMCWNLRDGRTLPENNPKSVWSDYVGVWHMDEEITSATAASTLSADATGHGLDATPYPGSKGDASVMTSTAGVFGNARINDTAARNGNFLAVEDVDGRLNVGSTFTISLWLKIDDYISSGYPQIVTRRQNGSEQNGYQVHLGGTDARNSFSIRGKDASPSALIRATESNFKDIPGYTHVAFVYEGTNVTLYAEGLAKGSGEIHEVNDVAGDWMGIGNRKDGTEQSLWGKYDEIRFSKGARSAAWIAAENDLGTNSNFYTAGAVTNDDRAVLKNEWTREPSITKTIWTDGTYPKESDFDLGQSSHGSSTITFYNRRTGEILGDVIPTAEGDYRAVITVPQSKEQGTSWGALERSIEFRIVDSIGSHDFGINIDRILLMNDDYRSEGTVLFQSYNDEDDSTGYPHWLHLDSDGQNVSSTPKSDERSFELWPSNYWSVSLDFNLGGGTHHVYQYGDRRLWDLDGVRIGNTFNNGELLEDVGVYEEDDEGLAENQNYLCWDPDSLRVVNDFDEAIGPYHRFAGQLAVQNKSDAAITSSLYTNGIGTIYFDAVNGWADNVYDEDGNPNYALVLEIATNTLGSTLSPTDERTDSTYLVPLYDENGVETGSVARLNRAAAYADWKPVSMRVLRMDGSKCRELATTSRLVLDIEEGGTYERFYRIIAPVNTRLPARFRIRRVAIDPTMSEVPDGYAYILMDNIICSTPTAVVNLEPCGRYVETKEGKQVLGWEGAFNPPFPSTSDVVVKGRAKATLSDGQPLTSGVISSATMHYRWHYLDQRTTDWLLADLDPDSLVSLRALELPGYQGDIDFWFDLNQTGDYYEYMDYSGTGHGLGGTGYSEAVGAVTNRAPSYAKLGDWFVRMRDGASSYAEMKLLVKTSLDATPVEIDMLVAKDNLWRGYYRMTSALADGIWWRVEPRDCQTAGATSWNSSTNYWYVADWVEKLPTFPTANRFSEGSSDSWSRMPCDAQTGYLMFQVDESSKGVTVIHADYQDFNKWNDAAKAYFVGSFAGTNEMSKAIGTSPDVRTYTLNYSSWDDTQATNRNWTLSFAGRHIGDTDYPGYTTFASWDKEGIWHIGKGMWVYGKYREAQSPLALQMRGCGDGLVEFSKQGRIVWPRGLESISFDARIAQPISPEYSIYYGPGWGLSNYAFMTYGCLDMKSSMGFSGNASISLFAYYRPGVGAYEARWEQVHGKIEASGPYAGIALGPEADGKKGQRLVISRWNWEGNEYVETVLCAVTNSSDHSGKFNFDAPLMSGPVTNNLLPFCISVFKDGSDTLITAGVYSKGGSTPNVTPKTKPEQLNEKSGENGFWYFAAAREKPSAKPLRGGSYGVLSANCEGLFLTPQFRSSPMYPSDVDPSKIGTGCYSRKFANNLAHFVDCHDDMTNVEEQIWSIDNGREKAFYDPESNTNDFGFAYVAPSQYVDIELSTPSSDDWWLKERIHLTGFGSPGATPDYQPTFYYTSDCAMRIKTGGGYDDTRTDVVIADIVQRQWRGYNSGSGEKAFDKRTNFVFTCGWVTNGAAQLSAKRTPEGEPCSIRSPLLDGSTRYGVGVGLGRIGITYREPQSNVLLRVQIATNLVSYTETQLDELTAKLEDAKWVTVASNIDYKTLWTDITKSNPDGTKTWDFSLGYHGAQGIMRVIVDPSLVKQVAATNWLDPNMFGAIDITSIMCEDEPALDKGCWWGWNMKTIGDVYDSERRMYLPDCAANRGMSLALNNSVTDQVSPAERTENVVKHMPFVQSPTFTNALIGQITFKARKYDLADNAPTAKVVVFGVTGNPDEAASDADWATIAEFPITNSLYTSYTVKTDAAAYRALRLGVVNVEGTKDQPSPWNPPDGSAQRVLIDEVTISEVARAMLAFKNVGAFRSNLGATDNSCVSGVTTRDQQPMCDENWGIQAEVFATMLADEIYTKPGYEPQVRLHWYVGKEPWGYDNWKSIPEKTVDKTTGKIIRDGADLAETDDATYVFRSSYPKAQDAVMLAQSEPGTVVQYMLEVRYYTLTEGSLTPVAATNWLDSTSWTTPEWYAPVDYNADLSINPNRRFAAFTILDNVAPSWAWINEVNVLGVKTALENTDKMFQYVEVCVPMEADITGWSLRFLEANIGNDEVVTNVFATFGDGIMDNAPGKKTANAAYKKTFRLLGNKESDQMSKAKGTLDGTWRFRAEPDDLFRWSETDKAWYIHREYKPFGVQLVRSSGVIESSVVVVGTNRLGRIGYRDYDPTNIVEFLNRKVPGSNFFYAAEDCMGTFRSGSVTDQRGETADVWANDWACSPGFINSNFTGQVQIIDPDHPTPHGDSIVVYATVDTSGGKIVQYVGGPGSSLTNSTEAIILRRGGEGTNILYRVAPWYELAGVTTNKIAAWNYVPRIREVSITVGKGASNNVDVLASAQLDSLLREYLKDDPYKPAVLSWLENGTDAYGNEFMNPGEIGLADVLDMQGNVVTNLGLTQMYWLDMDPTIGNLALQVGFATNPSIESSGNIKMGVFMMITNRNDFPAANDKYAWSPYILRGHDPNFTSWDYAESTYGARAWTSETFTVTGILGNDLKEWADFQRWVQLRWFVFYKDSFYQPEDEGHKPFSTDIEIVDPKSRESWAAEYWYDYLQDPAHSGTPMFHWFSIDTRSKPVAPEVLKKENYYSE